MCSRSVPDTIVRYLLWSAATSPIVFLASTLLLLLPIDPARVTLAWLAIPVIHRFLRWRFRAGSVRSAADQASA